MALISIFILFCAFQLYQIQNVSSSKRIQFKIDDFINQLMTSEKFSELTEIVAEKAAKKIKSVQQDNKEEHSSVKEFRNKVDTQTEIPEYETVKENEKVKSRKGVSTSKFGKINTDAFLKQDIKSGEILLNYKHMTDELKRSDHKINTQINGENLSDRDRGTRYDRDSKMNREKHSKKPKYQSKELKTQPRKQLKTNKVYEEMKRNFNKMNKSMNQDSSSAEIIYNNVNNTADVEASEEHEIFIKTDVDVAPELNVRKGPNSNENLDKYESPDEKNEVDSKSIKNNEKNSKAVKTPETSNKELDVNDKSIKNPEKSSENDKEHHESINDQENTSEKFEQNALVMESLEKSIEAYPTHENLNKKSPEYFKEKKYSKTIKYQENKNEKLEISSTPIEILIEMDQPKPKKIQIKKIGNIQNNNRPEPQKGTPRFRTQKSKTTSKADQTTEHVEDYSDVLNFEGAKDILLKEPILKVPYPIISQKISKINTQNYSEPDYKEYNEKFVSKGNFKHLNN